MSNAAIMGWDADAGEWRKVLVNAAGKLIIDPSEIFEDPPTDGEAGKSATSNWSHDHAADVSAHHVKYTDAEAMEAWGNRSLILTTGSYTITDLSDYNLVYLTPATGNINLCGFAGGTNGKIVFFIKTVTAYDVAVCHNDPSAPAGNKIYTSSNNYEVMVNQYRGGFTLIYYNSYWHLSDVIISSKAQLFDDTPVDSRYNKGVTSNWGFDHKADVSAHHAKYTDAEARAAVGYNGTRYWSCNGIHFDAMNPPTDLVTKSNEGFLKANADGIYFLAPVFLPHGAVVTNVIVNGNAAAAAEVWTLERQKISDKTISGMASVNINTGSSSIAYATIDNSLYSYFIHTTSLDTDDEIWGAVITYTI